MNKVILLVEDNRSDEKLTLLAFAASGVDHEVVVVRDGAEALDYLFGTGVYAARDTTQLPALVLLDLQLPRIDGHGVLQRIRADVTKPWVLPLTQGGGLNSRLFRCRRGSIPIQVARRLPPAHVRPQDTFCEKCESEDYSSKSGSSRVMRARSGWNWNQPAMWLPTCSLVPRAVA